MFELNALKVPEKGDFPRSFSSHVPPLHHQSSRLLFSGDRLHALEFALCVSLYKVGRS